MTEDCDKPHADKPSYYLPRHEFSAYTDLSQKALTTAMSAAEKAAEKASAATERRFESVNEFRAALSDLSNTFVSRNEYLSGHTSLIQRLEMAGNRIAAIEGRSSGSSDTIGRVLAVVAVMVSIAVALITFSHAK